MNGPSPDAPLDAAGFALVGSAAEVREMDHRTISTVGLPGLVLMELAGAGTARLIRERCGGRPGRAVILCGGGNNGGDGYVIARHLADCGWTVRCIALSDPGSLRGDAATNHGIWAARGGEMRVVGDKVTARVGNWLGHANVIVDALFGTGLNRPLEGSAAAVVEAANSKDHGLKVAVDVPSGVNADTGAVMGCAFRADLTATYGLSKIGLHQYPGADQSGEVVVVGIGMPRPTVDEVGASFRLATERAVAGALPGSEVAGHKGRFGHVGVVGGRGGTQGAAVLTARAALRGGAGLVTWCREADTVDAVTRAPEIMVHDEGTLDARSSVLVVGPGLGTDGGAERWLHAALHSKRGLVVDADALNLLARTDAGPLLAAVAGADAVLTPHPAEAGRLLGVTTAEVQADRPAAARALAERYDAVVVLKGAATLVAGPGRETVVLPGGEPTLAVAGSGDVLAGLIGALRAQGASAQDAAVAGAFVHVRAGSTAGSGRGDRGALASEIADHIPAVIANLRVGWLAA